MKWLSASQDNILYTSLNEDAESYIHVVTEILSLSENKTLQNILSLHLHLPLKKEKWSTIDDAQSYYSYSIYVQYKFTQRSQRVQHDAS